MTTFTASEVREKEDIQRTGARLCQGASDDSGARMWDQSADMLHAFADRLEADERGVPAAYAEFTDGGCIRMWSRQYEERLPGTRMIPLYTHPAPSDAERLAEAVRNGLIDALRHQRKIDEDGTEVGVSREAIDDAAAILSALAAHYAQAQSASGGAMSPDAETLIGQHVSCIRAEALAIQKGVNPLNCAERIVERCDKLAEKIRESAQPPAASATPNLASYWRIVAEAAEVLQMVLDSGVKLPPNWRWPLLDELSGLSAMMLAAQENPNG